MKKREELIAMRNWVLGGIVGVVLTAGVILGATAASGSSPRAAGASASAPQEEFMFEVPHYHTALQGGQTINFYLRYRYLRGLPTAQYPNYLDIRRMLLTYMAHVNPDLKLFWEIHNTRICTKIKRSFPLQAISCQFQVYPDNRPGPAYQPGFHSSIVTIGNIEPLAQPGP